MFNPNEWGPLSHTRRQPNKNITDDVSPYPLHELEDARNELINLLYPSHRASMFHQIRGLVGIIPNRFGQFPYEASMMGRESYGEHSTSQLSDQLPWPLAPSHFSLDNTGESSVQNVNECLFVQDSDEVSPLQDNDEVSPPQDSDEVSPPQDSGEVSTLQDTECEDHSVQNVADNANSVLLI